MSLWDEGEGGDNWDANYRYLSTDRSANSSQLVGPVSSVEINSFLQRNKVGKPNWSAGGWFCVLLHRVFSGSNRVEMPAKRDQQKFLEKGKAALDELGLQVGSIRSEATTGAASPSSAANPRLSSALRAKRDAALASSTPTSPSSQESTG